MIVHTSEAPGVPDVRSATEPTAEVGNPRLPAPPSPPAALVFGAFIVPVGAVVGGLFALLVLAARSEGDDHAAAVFAAIAVLGILTLITGVLLDAFGSIVWAVRLHHSRVRRHLPKLLRGGLIAWAGAIVVGIAAFAGLLPTVGNALAVVSFVLCVAGAAFLAVGSDRMLPS